MPHNKRHHLAPREVPKFLPSITKCWWLRLRVLLGMRYTRPTTSYCPNYFRGREPTHTKRSPMGLLCSKDILFDRSWSSSFTFNWGRWLPFSFTLLHVRKQPLMAFSTLQKVSPLDAILSAFVQTGMFLGWSFGAGTLRFPYKHI